MPTSLPRVIFLAREGRPGNESALLLAIRARGYLVTAIRSVDEMVPAIDSEPGRAIVIADLMSTLYEPTKIDGYDDFLHVYGRARMTRDVTLFVIDPGHDEAEQPDTMIGYGRLVTCYLRAPVNPFQLVQFLDKTAGDEQCRLPLRHE